MSPELQQRIAAIKAECEEILKLSGKATQERWKPDGDVIDTCMGVIHCDTQSDSVTNASFIAHARNVSTAMARVVLWAIDQYERGEFNDAIATELANQWGAND